MSLQGIARDAGGALLTQAGLHAELLGEAWQEEKIRLRGMALALLLGFACLLCTLLAVNVLVLALSWDTPRRVPVIASLLALYVAGMVVAWRILLRQSALRNEALVISRDELAADLRLLRSRL